jgi:hypothetical protein
VVTSVMPRGRPKKISDFAWAAYPLRGVPFPVYSPISQSKLSFEGPKPHSDLIAM